MTSAALARRLPQARLRRREESKRRRARLYAWANVAWRQLIEKLGARCADCGDDGTYTLLTVDHVEGRTWNARALRFDTRVQRYWEEYAAGVPLAVRCLPCNSRGQARFRGANRRY